MYKGLDHSEYLPLLYKKNIMSHMCFQLGTYLYCFALIEMVEVCNNSSLFGVPQDAWRNTLVTVEVLCWFFIGECIGKGTLVGYQV